MDPRGRGLLHGQLVVQLFPVYSDFQVPRFSTLDDCRLRHYKPGLGQSGAVRRRARLLGADLSYDAVSKHYFITATYRGNEDDAEPRCQMVVSAERPEGPYGEPAWIHEDGIDPSILHDDDGRHYMLFNRSVRMAELTPDCRAMRGPARLIWGGDLKNKTEVPSL